MENKSHMTDVMQRTRLDLENGGISHEEKEEAIRVSTISHCLESNRNGIRSCALWG